MIDLPLHLDRDGTEPLSAQLVAALRAALLEGRLTAGERLPATRALAATLGVSRTVVTEAYEQLYAEGWLEGRHGSGTYVADVTPSSTTRAGALPAAPTPPYGENTPAVGRGVTGEGWIDLRPGVPWTGGLDTAAWRRAWREAARDPAVVDLRNEPYGRRALREALAERMRRGRGVAVPAERVVVTRGATHGLDLLAAVAVRPGDRVGVEEPGYGKARAILAARGARVVPCPVDEHGLVVDALPEDLRLIYTTPSHQFPLGGVLPVPRRQALLRWAARTCALVVEDDYDGEFRYDVAPLPALYGLDPERVVYLGTTAKTLTPEMGIGWLAARPDLAAAVAVHREAVNDRTPFVPQEALRVFLEQGDLDRHIRRMRAEYARRRQVVVDTLAGLPLRGDTAGLHMVLLLPGGRTAELVARAADEGVLLDDLARYTSVPGPDGLVIGYSAASTRDLKTACTLVRALATADP